MSDAENDGGARDQDEEEEDLERQEESEGEDIGHMEQEQHLLARRPTLPHTKPLVAAYIVIIVFIIMGITSMVLLHFIPKAEMQSLIIHQTDTIIVPLNPSSKWLKSVSFHTSDGCMGDLYKIPCDKLQPERNSSYRSNKPPYHNPSEYIYCIDGSTFTWTLTTETFTGVVEIWLFTSPDEASEYDKHGTTLNCAQSPTCVVMNTSTSHVVSLTPAKYDPLHGQFYFVRKSTGAGPGMKLVIDRYYYNTSVKYENYKLASVDSKSYVSDLQGNFDAAQVVPSTNDCFLFNTTLGEGSKHNGTLTVTPVRSDYVLFWPGLFAVLWLFLLILLISFHIAYFRKFQAAQRANFDELRCN